MMYNVKYFKENAKYIETAIGGYYELNGHKIVIDMCRNPRYRLVMVDGNTIATKIEPERAVQKALAYLNEQ